MFGWTLIKNSELLLMRQLADIELKAAVAAQRRAEQYAEKAERLVDTERVRIDAERERADRIADSLFQASGLPATSTTVVSEQKATEKVHAEKLEDYMRELAEIYSETEQDMAEDGAEPLPEILEDKKP